MIVDVEAKIRAAVAEAKSQGWCIIRRAYYVPPNCCCPLGALVLDEIAEASGKAEVPERAARMLGITPRDAIDIAWGVDNDYDHSVGKDMLSLGMRLRELVGP